MSARMLLPLVLAGAIAGPAAHGAVNYDQAVVLVAKREFQHPLYGSSVLIARAVGGDQHLGFIVNRPTRLTLGAIFPSHPPSRQVLDPVHLGGPFHAQLIFALVRRPASPGGMSLRLAPELFAAFDRPTVDRIIEEEPEHARFLAGLVAWQPGELRMEIERGLWHVLEPDAALVLRRPAAGLWEELVRRAERTGFPGSLFRPAAQVQLSAPSGD